MTPLRFRAWLPLEKRMIDVDNVEVIAFKDWNFEGGMSITVRSKFDEIDETYQSEPLEFQLMQSTGLKDKNEKEIFEGDIHEHKGHSGETYRCICEWDDIGCGFNFKVISADESTMLPSRQMLEMGVGDYWSINAIAESGEIIGNIYQNPELLK